MNAVEFVKLPCCINETKITCDGSPLLYRRFVRDERYGFLKKKRPPTQGTTKGPTSVYLYPDVFMKLRLLVNGNAKSWCSRGALL